MAKDWMIQVMDDFISHWFSWLCCIW